MRARLLALAATIAGLGAGVITLARWETGSVDPVLQIVGGLEFINRETCTVAACNATPCTQALNVLQDAGSACAPVLAECDFRVGQNIRNMATDAGLSLRPGKYQRLRLVALRCPGADGGFAFGVPFNDGGLPVYAVLTGTPKCVRAPLDGGSDCRRTEGDGGFRFFGTGNVFPASQSTGTQCEAIGCGVFAGDNPDTDL